MKFNRLYATIAFCVVAAITSTFYWVLGLPLERGFPMAVWFACTTTAGVLCSVVFGNFNRMN